MKVIKRSLLLVLAAAAVVSLLNCGGKKSSSPAASSGELSGEIRFSWWGNEARNTATIEVIKLFESKHPGVKIIPEYGTVDGYQNKLMAQIAAGNAPDIFTTVPESIPTLVEVNGLADLTGLIDVSGQNQQVNQACSLNGKQYGINVALGANVIYYNKTLAEELGIKMPEGNYTWNDLIRICGEVHTKTGGKTFGMVDIRMVAALDTWLPVFNITHDGREAPFPWTEKEVLINAGDVESFMSFFSNAPRGVLLPPDETAVLSSQINAPIGTRKAFLEFNYTGTFGMIQSQTSDELAMIEMPHDGKGSGAAVFARPGLIECVFQGSKNKALAVAFLDFFSNDPEAAKILKTVRGVLPTTAQREALLSDPAALSDIDRKIFDITNRIYNKPVNPFSPGPVGTGVLFDDLHIRVLGGEVAFGRITPAQAGQRFEQFIKEVIE
ncbi:MAG: extracellular solute-binding protein [Treponema sp.]|jgi:ABC-type glycerol-3-phosphate transport system substrate-binding protein|nr:extracellular solute-binding protein [Treponema sp.]